MHTRDRFKAIVDGLNNAFSGCMTFELAGSLAQGIASDHNADIVVHTQLPVPLSALKAGIEQSGMGQVIAVDTASTTPFPGRPNGQDRVQVKFATGEIVDLFFRKGLLHTASPRN